MSETRAPLRVLSFGAGVQSSYLARASIIGDIAPFDHVIFADTGDEPAAVYQAMEWWRRRFTDAGMSFHVVYGRTGYAISADLRRVIVGESTSAGNPPLFTVSEDGRAGMIRRKCTSDYKVAPIQRKLRELVGVAGKRHNHITDVLAVQTFGISWDEAQRMRDPAYTWLRHDYPLVDGRTTRHDCIATLQSDSRFPDPVRSACWHCPFHSDEEWRYLRDNDPESFLKAVALDRDLRTGSGLSNAGLTSTVYLHRSRKPLGEIDFDNEEDKGQGSFFSEECEGMCGL